jgi:DNA-binding GntR family transcriptional regulator
MAMPGRLGASLDEIAAVLNHVRNHDAEHAAKAIHESVMNAREAALRQLAAGDQPRT